MKQKSLTITLFTLCILGLAVSLTACGRDCFVGSRTAEAGSYRLDIDRMTGTDRFTMELRAGDTLAVQFETVKGSIYMEIKEPDESSLYEKTLWSIVYYPEGRCADFYFSENYAHSYALVLLEKGGSFWER